MQYSKPKQNVLAGQSWLETHPSRPEIKIIRNLAIYSISKLAKIGNREIKNAVNWEELTVLTSPTSPWASSLPYTYWFCIGVFFCWWMGRIPNNHHGVSPLQSKTSAWVFRIWCKPSLKFSVLLICKRFAILFCSSLSIVWVVRAKGVSLLDNYTRSGSFVDKYILWSVY